MTQKIEIVVSAKTSTMLKNILVFLSPISIDERMEDGKISFNGYRDCHKDTGM